MTDQNPPQMTATQALRVLHEAARLAPLPYTATVNVEIAAEALAKVVNTISNMPTNMDSGEFPEPTPKKTSRGRRSSSKPKPEPEVAE